ncbi:amino acid permease [Carbonactinospora thermoautotrophica]|uniref:amino acid permease n=1 Tax=Carbonactinospora thermoautotrophica TaxID=1469144 RepID=UPI00226DA22B|nr:amino acid permease [Carbonactinospora thermoautotrophica]MCX9193241.1 amino acid permease [Carbonactinospora thermoautotrophica]
MNGLFRTKSLDALQADPTVRTGLRRTLGLWQLTAIGIGGIIGVGIFVLTGQAAATKAGPAVAISFVIAGIASAAAALCYAEFAGMIPVAGSAYTYGYAVLGELVAWIIGWDLLLEYTVVVAVVAIGLGGYVNALLDAFDLQVPAWMQGAPGTGEGRVVNLFAVLICLFVAWLLARGIKESARLNNVMVVIKLAVVVLIITVGAFYVNPDNLTPFAPFGISGIFAGAGLVFFAVYGYDTLTTAAEEAVNPQRDLPRAVLLSLLVSMTAYIGMSLVLTGMAPYQTLNVDAPVAKVFVDVGLPVMSQIISVAAIAGITSVLLAFALAGARIWFAMSRDGLLPIWFARVHPTHRTPYRPTWIIGVVTAVVAGFTPIAVVAELANIGTLVAFIIVCTSVLVLRYRRPDARRGFRAPALVVVAPLGVVSSVVLIAVLDPLTWVRFLIWMLLGLVVYFAYGRRHSRVAVEPGVPAALEEA